MYFLLSKIFLSFSLSYIMSNIESWILIIRPSIRNRNLMEMSLTFISYSCIYGRKILFLKHRPVEDMMKMQIFFVRLCSLSKRKKKSQSAPWSQMEKRKAKRSDSRLCAPSCHLLDVTSYQRTVGFSPSQIFQILCRIDEFFNWNCKVKITL